MKNLKKINRKKNLLKKFYFPFQPEEEEEKKRETKKKRGNCLYYENFITFFAYI